MFIAALFNSQKEETTQVCIDIERVNNIWYNRILFSLLKGGNSDIYYNMDKA
jgi:hypothetical protein